MNHTASRPVHGSGLSLRECLAAWVVAFALVTAMAASSLVAILFDGWV